MPKDGSKIDKSEDNQTDLKKQQTENIKKWDVPLDEGTDKPKGETFGEFVLTTIPSATGV